MIESRIVELGITLPQASTPAANYVPFVQTGDLIFIAGQLPFENGKISDAHKGKVGQDLAVEDAQKAAQLCALNICAQLKAACGGDLEKVAQCVRLGIFVNSSDDFIRQPEVGNGASDVIVSIFGDRGKHARAAVGVNTLPRGVVVEIDAVFRISE